MAQRIVIISLIFVAAFSVRLMVWNNKHAEAPQVQSGVAENYKHLARLLTANGLTSFFDPSSTTSNPDLLGHPPGYSIVLAFIYKLAGESDTAAQLFQIFCDSLCAVLIFLIAIELLPLGVGAIAGFMAAFAPQFSWNSILLLPDTLAALPILAGILVIARAFKRPSLVSVLGAGACIGVSCWLRANGLLLGPFLAFLVVLIFPRELKMRMALALVAGFVVVVAPLTIRNAIVFGHFIPVSLGGGQTLLEGIADYDEAGRFGVPATDIELIKQEAHAKNRPDYATTLFGPDAIRRDRERLARGFAIIRANPLWFFSVVVRRAMNMWRLERVPLISTTNLPSGWTRYIYLVVRLVQRLFITAVVLPFVLIGLMILIWQRRFHVVAILLGVPVYYFCVQSILHTEYRYVLALHYFLFVLAGVGVYRIGWWVHSSRPKFLSKRSKLSSASF
ncbi:MAG TPA: glycosyltransferase family 39 protein [Pyrinomonadaceae bacterium]|nr:glycosyltransferase family 39 protein [Pyrinomonadaceae bacterium]